MFRSFLLVLALLPGTAQAADMHAFERAQAVAASYFTPRCESVHLRWGFLGVPAPGEVPVGTADIDRCELAFDPVTWRWSWRLICTAMVHEYGHLAGFDHTGSPRSVMHEPPLFEPRRCATDPVALRRSTSLPTRP